MKRKVAVWGRSNREFSWSMSVEPGERYLPKHKRRKRASELPCAACCWKTPDFVPDSSFGNRVEQTPCFFRTRKKRTGRCCRKCLPCKNAACGRIPTFYYIGAADKRNLDKEANTMAIKEKIRVRLKSYDHVLIDTAAKKIVEVATRNGAEVSGPIPLPTEKEIITILRAVHKYKDSREQFEYRTHKRLIDIIKPSQKTVDALMSVELPAGVEIEIKL